MVSTTIQSAWNDYLQGQNVDFESLSDKCIQCCHQSSACIAKCNEVRGGMVNFIEDCKFHEWDDLLEEGHQMVSSVDMHIDMLHDTVEIIENLQVRFLEQVKVFNFVACDVIWVLSTSLVCQYEVILMYSSEVKRSKNG